MTKSQLYKAYAGKGPTRMVCEFLSECELRQHAILITEISAPLEMKYVHDLRAQQGGFETMLQWTADRSLGQSWWGTAQEIIAASFNLDLVFKLGVTPPMLPPLEFDSSLSWMVVPCIIPCFHLTRDSGKQNCFCVLIIYIYFMSIINRDLTMRYKGIFSNYPNFQSHHKFGSPKV